MEQLLEFIKRQLELAEQALHQAEETVRLMELMGIDASEAKLRLETERKRFLAMKAGYEQYLRQKGMKT